jgi:Domain of unknown function (DUF4386)
VGVLPLHSVFTWPADTAGVNVELARPHARVVGLVYLAYAVIAGIGQGIAFLAPGSAIAAAAQVAGTLWYAFLATLLCRLFGDPARGAGFLAMVCVVIGCVLQSLYYAIGLGRQAELLALVFFGLFLVCLGFLVIRSALIPRAIGIWLMAGGLAWCLVVLPGPAALLGAVIILAGASELALMLWLLIRGTRVPGARSAAA